MKKNRLLHQVFPLAVILALLVTGLLIGSSLTAPGERQEIDLPMIEKEQGNRGEVVPPMATTGLASTETTSDINVGPGSLVALAADEPFDAALKEPPVLEEEHSLAGITEEYVPMMGVVPSHGFAVEPSPNESVSREAEAADAHRRAPLNPDFIEYLENPPEFFYGYVPHTMDLSHLRDIPARDVLTLAQPPSDFDWRDTVES